MRARATFSRSARAAISIASPSVPAGSGTTAHQPQRSWRSKRGIRWAHGRCGEPSTSSSSSRTPGARPSRNSADGRPGGSDAGSSLSIATSAGGMRARSLESSVAMIAFGCSITDPPMYERAAGPGIEVARESDSVILARAAAGSIFRSYNMILDDAAKLDGLEALILVHQDAQLTQADTCARVRKALADPDVGLAGCVGAVGVRSIAWWDGSVTWASFT